MGQVPPDSPGIDLLPVALREPVGNKLMKPEPRQYVLPQNFILDRFHKFTPPRSSWGATIVFRCLLLCLLSAMPIWQHPLDQIVGLVFDYIADQSTIAIRTVGSADKSPRCTALNMHRHINSNDVQICACDH